MPDTSIKQNPFLLPYTAAHEAVPFDRILLEHYMPAVRAGIEQQDAEIKNITDDARPATFANTIEALETSGEVLTRVCNVFFNLLECEGTDEMLKLSEEIQPLLSEHSNNMALNEALFARIETVWKHREQEDLTHEQYMLLKETYEGYLRNGATLEADKRKRWREINTELDALTLQYGQNALRATNAYECLLTDEQDLAGLPAFVVESMAEEAAHKNKTGWLLTLQAPSFRPFMTYSARRDLREKLYKAYNSRATEGSEFSNVEIIRRITSLRLEKAQMMGKKNFAEYHLEDTMAKTVRTVEGLLHSLLEAYREPAQQEVQEVADFATQSEGHVVELQPWDFAYYSNLLKKERYAVDDELLKPYFPLDRVKKGIFRLATTLYGLQFRCDKTLPRYNPEVEVYEVSEADGRYLGLLYIDLFPRSTKQAGAWMTEFKNQWIDAGGNDSRPHISIVTNFTKPTTDKPSLLTYDEVGTFLHEFGHALHGLLTRCHYASLSGTHVAHDFVELPSQFMENYLNQKAFLDTFAQHHQTGESIPEALIERIHRAKNFQAAYLCVRQLTFGMLDMAFHTITTPITGSIADFERQATETTRLLPAIDGTMIAPAFSHIFAGGYAAGYYGYKWAEVLDADTFAVFEQHGIFDPATARRFRHLLESGGSIEPDRLYREFKGADPDITALMRRDGILK